MFKRAHVNMRPRGMLLAAALTVAQACGGPASLPSMSPSGPLSPSASPASPSVPAPVIDPSIDPSVPPPVVNTLPSQAGGTAPPTSNHASPELEAQLPTQVAGATLDRHSYDGQYVLQFNSESPVARAIRETLDQSGQSPGNLAVATAATAGGSVDITVTAFRIASTPADRLLMAFRSTFEALDVPVEDVIVLGRPVMVIRSYSDTTIYLYPLGDVLFGIESDSLAIVEQVLASIPAATTP